MSHGEDRRTQGGAVTTLVDTAQAVVLSLLFTAGKRVVSWQLGRMAKALTPKPRTEAQKRFHDDNDNWWRGGYQP